MHSNPFFFLGFQNPILVLKGVRHPLVWINGDANVNTKQGISCVIRFGHNDVIKGQKWMRCQWLIIQDAQWTFWIVLKKFSYFQELHEIL
jgi:hypothetical protein